MKKFVQVVKFGVGLACGLLGVGSVAQAQTATTVETLTTQVSGIGTTAQTVFLSIAGISVGAFVIRMIIKFAKKGSV